MDLKQQPVDVSKGKDIFMENISLTTKKGIDIVKNVTIAFPGRELTAIIGPSGCGKTSILEALVFGTTESRFIGGGKVYINNGVSPINVKRTSHISFVAQADSLLEVFTPREMLTSAAQLYFGYYDPSIERRIKELMDELDLTACADTRVQPTWGKQGLTSGEKRRLSIALELISPTREILVLDEPVTGLDSQSSLKVITLLKKMAKAGTTVVASIHQPSSEVWDMFESFALMSKGKLVFSGVSKEGLDFFAAIGIPAPSNWNPSEFYLEQVNTDFHQVTEEAVDRAVNEFASSKYALVIAGKKPLSEAPLSEQQNVVNGGVPSQFAVLSIRHAQNAWRNPGYFWIRLVIYTLLSLILGILFLNKGANLNDQSVMAVAGLLFFVSGIMIFMSVASLPFLVKDRAVFLKEKRMDLYWVSVYVWAYVLAVCVPVTFVVALVSSVIIVPMTQIANLGWFILILWMSLLMAETFNGFVGAISSSFVVGLLIVVGYWSTAMTVEGFFITIPTIPLYMRWLCWITPMTYAYQAFMQNQFTPTTVINNSPVFKTGLDVTYFFGYQTVFVLTTGQDLLVLTAFFLVFTLLMYLTLRFYY